MKIPEPPRPGPNSFGLEPVDQMVQWVNNHLNDDHFDLRYFPKFEWFKDELSNTERILNIGCGQGRETFALMWNLNAVEALGIDIDDDPKQEKVFTANVIANAIQEFARKFNSQVIPEVSRMYSSEYVNKLRDWYDTSIPDVIKSCTVPVFLKMDITEKDLLNHVQPNYYDLVYSSYVLDKILDKDEHGVFITIKNMMSLVKPESGRLVFVVPTKKEIDGIPIQYDFEQYILRELAFVKIERDEYRLGRPEWHGTEPIGYILKRN